jgi:hypothetical protein
VIESPKFGRGFKSEFWSKLGSCFFSKAINVVGVNRDRALVFLRDSIQAYLEALWLGEGLSTMDMSETLVWMQKPLQKFVEVMGGDIDQFFSLLESLVERKHDIDQDGSELLLRYLTRSPVPADKPMRDRLRGLCARTIGKVNRLMRPLSSYPGFKKVVETLEAVIKEVEAMRA